MPDGYIVFSVTCNFETGEQDLASDDDEGVAAYANKDEADRRIAAALSRHAAAVVTVTLIKASIARRYYPELCAELSYVECSS